MQLKKATLMTLAAIYAGGVGTIAAAPSGHQNQYNGSDLRAVNLAEAMIEQTEQVRRHDGMEEAMRPGAVGLNVHRAIAPIGAKVPFEWEQDLDAGDHTYIIQMTDAPVALYQGERAGFEATSPRVNQPAMRSSQRYGALNVNTSAVKSYRSFLTEQQDLTANRIQSVAPGAQIERRFSIALNGMTMRLSQAQAAEVAKMPGVKAVTRAKEYQLFTDVGPEHIGADKLWQGQGVPNNLNIKGEGIIAGIIDTGINSDHPSFADIAGDGYDHTNPFGEGNYVGDCAEDAYAHMCNDKLIGVRSYDIITDTYKDPIFQPELGPWDYADYKRPPNGEDYNGHGSHTAGTVAGNLLYDVPFKLGGTEEVHDGFDTPLIFPQVSGVAPRANIIAYQVCYPGGGSYGESYGGCPGDALVAAIEDAILDGVDVINFSIGGLESLPWYDAIEMAFLAAREAGISVAASAGNFGSYGPSLIDHVSPWLTSVAASTHGREITAEAGSLGSFVGADAPAEIVGQGITGNFTGTLVDAADFGDGLCLEPFPAGTFEADQIVLCKRGDIARVAKGVNVAEGGAGGVILYNALSWDDGTGSNSLNLNPFPIPGLHVDYAAGQALVNWVAATDAPQATITESVLITAEREADVLAGFSSRGPSISNPNVMVPNVSAPGVDVFAAYADEMPFSKYPSPTDYAAISGTSMSGPHVAGALALLTQAHPNWTPAMIQSALMTTALPGKSYDYSYPPKLVDASFYEMGSGVINVARAVKAGLVLDENGDNYRAANPELGGDVTALNVPYLVNNDCQGTCTWMRTFTATTDGTWTVTAEELEADGAPFLELSATPSEFTLKAGESQSIMVTANILDVETVNVTSASNEVFGKVHLTPADDSLPDQYLPMMARFGNDSLPQIVQGDIHRDAGTMLTPPLMTREITELGVSVSGLVAGEMMSFQLPKAMDYNFRDPDSLAAADGIAIHFFDVPEGTRRLVWEVAEEDRLVKSQIDIGMDLNDNGKVEWYDEAICYSFTDLNDYCTINDPTPGRYWVMVGNYKDAYDGSAEVADNITMSLAMVGSDDDQNLMVSGPSSTDGLSPYQLQMDWNLDSVEEGQRFYGLIEVGNTPENIGNIGKMGINLTYAGDDVMVSSNKPQAGEGDIVTFEVEVLPNLLGLERDVTLDVELSSGLQLLEGSLSAISNNQDLASQLVIEGNKIGLDTTQMASNAVDRQYLFTTSMDDATCRIPIGSDPYYLDLYDAAYIEPDPAIQGAANQTVMASLSMFGLKEIPLYGNAEHMERDIIQFSPGGFIQVDSLPLFWGAHYPMDADFFPDTVIGPLWRGDGNTVYEFNMETESYDGVSIATTTDGRYLVVEWDNMRQGFAWGINFDPDPDARYSFELIASTELDFTPGEHEFIYAYDKITGAKSNLGSIGLHGYYGPRGTFGPAYGYLGDSYAFNDVDEMVEEGMVLCANYQGPEQSAITLSFAARVSAAATGQAQSVTVTSAYTGSDALVSTTVVDVPGNLSIGALSDMTVEENGSISFDVMVQDRENTANGISISADHVDATVEGHRVTLTPEAMWHGETMVTVTAYDLAHPNDAASTEFMLTVLSDGEAEAVLKSVNASATVSGNTIMLSADPVIEGTQGMDSLTETWTQLSGPEVTPAASIMDAEVGEYRFEVTYNLNGKSISAEVTATVSDAVATLVSINATASVDGDTITLSAEPMIDGTLGLDTLTESWTQVSGPEVTPAATISGAPVGDYVFAVTYTLNEESMSAEVSVSVDPAPAPEPAPEPQEEESSSSGSLGTLALMMLALLGWRRRTA
ncbi:S8 family peptidase [Ferrimonas balearica]|uniref:S8 family peptidase n=1 Tax=Ferrimonas balearica TaxID=44012 RepID=UPI001C955547|nr:S8 family serine peptidase [Ferrimonas balearica]MBY6107950.1 S8 family peptidase [Ferrimonas balearica]